MFANLLTIFAAGDPCQKHNFLGLVPWYQYLDYGPIENLTDNQAGQYCGINNFTLLGSDSDIPLILLAVVDDLIRVAGLIAVIFVIYGGIMYATSQGNPDQAAKAQSTIVNALIGLVLAVVAVTVVTFIGKALT